MNYSGVCIVPPSHTQPTDDSHDTQYIITHIQWSHDNSSVVIARQSIHPHIIDTEYSNDASDRNVTLDTADTQSANNSSTTPINNNNNTNGQSTRQCQLYRYKVLPVQSDTDKQLLIQNILSEQTTRNNLLIQQQEDQREQFYMLLELNKQNEFEQIQKQQMRLEQHEIEQEKREIADDEKLYQHNHNNENQQNNVHAIHQQLQQTSKPSTLVLPSIIHSRSVSPQPIPSAAPHKHRHRLNITSNNNTGTDHHTNKKPTPTSQPQINKSTSKRQQHKPNLHPIRTGSTVTNHTLTTSNTTVESAQPRRYKSNSISIQTKLNPYLTPQQNIPLGIRELDICILPSDIKQYLSNSHVFHISHDERYVIGLVAHQSSSNTHTDNNSRPNHQPLSKLIVLDRVASQHCISDKQIPTHDINGLTCTNDYQNIITSTHTGTVYLHTINWSRASIRTSYLWFKTDGQQYMPHLVAGGIQYSPDNTALVVCRCTSSKQLTVWSCSKHKLISSLDGHTSQCVTARWLNDSMTIISIGWDINDMNIRMFTNVQRNILPKPTVIGNIRTTLTRYQPPTQYQLYHANAFCISSCNQFLAAANGVTLFIYSLQTQQCIQQVTLTELMTLHEYQQDIHNVTGTIQQHNTLDRYTEYWNQYINPTRTQKMTRATLRASGRNQIHQNADGMTAPHKSTSLMLPGINIDMNESYHHNNTASMRVPWRPGSASNPIQSDVPQLLLHTYITVLQYSPDGTMLSYGTNIGTSGIWYISDTVRSHEYDIQHSDSVQLLNYRIQQYNTIQQQQQQLLDKQHAEQIRINHSLMKQQLRDQWLAERKQRQLDRLERHRVREENRRLRLYNGSLPESYIPATDTIPSRTVELPTFSSTEYRAELSSHVLSQGNFHERLSKDITLRQHKHQQRIMLKQMAEDEIVNKAYLTINKYTQPIVEQKTAEFLHRVHGDLLQREKFVKNSDQYYKQVYGLTFKPKSMH